MSEDEDLKQQHARDSQPDRGRDGSAQQERDATIEFRQQTTSVRTTFCGSRIGSQCAALFRADAEERQIVLQHRIDGNAALNGVQTAAIRDSLSNLVLNALQATRLAAEL